MKSGLIQYYFQLSFKRLSRKLTDLGIYPSLGILLILVAFILFSEILFIKTQYTRWLYILIATFFLINLSGEQRNNHLGHLFPKRIYYIIRLIENIGLAVPFIMFLIYKNAFLPALLLIPIPLMLTYLRYKPIYHKTIPTPFKKLPFEFIIGFRKHLWLLILVYFLIVKAIQVDNFNLAAVSMGFIFLISLSFYFKQENEYHVWIFGMNAKRFLIKKNTAAIICVSVLTLPALLIICFFYPEHILVLSAIQFAGYLYLSSIVFAKYSAFPRDIQLPQALIFGFSFWFPPMLLLILPLFYHQALKKLSVVLK